MKNRFLLIPILTVTSVVAVIASVQDSQTQLSSKQALALVRTINSVEATMKIKRSSYGSLQDVVAFGQLDKSFPIVSTDSSSATVTNYRISVVASADGQHYQISVHPISGCGVSFFTNESGVIYQGNALGCSTP